MRRLRDRKARIVYEVESDESDDQQDSDFQGSAYSEEDLPTLKKEDNSLAREQESSDDEFYAEITTENTPRHIPPIKKEPTPSETDSDTPLAQRVRHKKPTKPKLTRFQRSLAQLNYVHPELVPVWDKLRAMRRDKSKSAPRAEQPSNICISLLPFQLEGLYWMQQQEQSEWRGGLLADEMGMGKTIQMVSLLVADPKRPSLVVAPTVALLQWRNEMRKYAPSLQVLVWHGAQRAKDAEALHASDVVLTSYAVLESTFRRDRYGVLRNGRRVHDRSLLHTMLWRRIILDEAHHIKERTSNTSRSAFALQSDFKWCLSGTPLQNRVGELYAMVRFLGGDPFAYYYCRQCPCKSATWQFHHNSYCVQCGHKPMVHLSFWNFMILRPIQRDGTDEGDGEEAFARLRLLLDCIMLRRTKLERADDMGLPPRTIEVRRDFFSPEEEDLYKSLYSSTTRSFSTYLDQGTVLNNYSNIFTLLTRMRQMSNHPDLVLRSTTRSNADLLGKIDEINVCKLCLEEAEDGIMSQCRHVFCRACMQQYLNSFEGDQDPSLRRTHDEPDCPYCHAVLSVDLDAPALEPPQPVATPSDPKRQGILTRIDLSNWHSSTKIEALVEELTKLRELPDRTIKSLVFSQFVNFLDLIAFRLQRAGFRICRLEGNMTPEARDRTIQHFMENPGVTVFLVSLKAGGVALNLTEASRVYLMDPWWNPAVEVQAMDRIHRLGQHRPIVVKRMIIENSIESRIIELQNKKSK